MSEEKSDMELQNERSLDGLDRLLALRAEDLDGWEEAAASELPPDERASLEQEDAAFAELLQVWCEADEAIAEPTLSAADFVGLPQETVTGEPATALRPTRRRHAVRSAPPAWLMTTALAACLVVAVFASWGLKDLEPASTDLEGLKAVTLKAVTPVASTRVELQFSVERKLPTGVVTEAGRKGATYGTSDHLVLRSQVTGAGGFLYLFEVPEQGAPRLIWPASGAALPVGSGVHELRGDAGELLVWQPDSFDGTTRYAAIVTSEPSEHSSELLGSVLEQGVERSDLWPRSVLASDSFRIRWEDVSTH